MYKNIDFDIVADIYDDYVNVDFDIDFFKKFSKGYKNILELMCGTGRVSVPLIRDGFNLTCVDYSQGMLEIFRSKLLKTDTVRIECQNICNLDLQQQFDLIFIPFNSIAEIVDKEMRKKALQRIYEHLSTEGVFLCTLYNPIYRLKTADGNLRFIGKFPVGENNSLIVSYYNSHSAQDEIIFGTQFYELYGKDNKMIEKRFMDIRFSLISKDEIINMCNDIGFSLDRIYGDYNSNPFDENSMFMNCVFKKIST